MVNFQYSDDVITKITHEYSKHLQTTDNHLSSLVDMIGDEQFTCTANNFADNLLNKQVDVVYKYLFAHRSSVNQWPRWTGVLYGDEIMFVFGDPFKLV